MRSFGVVSPQFWTGHTGKRLRDYGPTVQLVAFYLLTSPHSHMCGLYYLPLQFIAHETGQPVKVIQKALDVLQNEKFAFYDEGTDFVWVKEMCHWQVGPMQNGDRRGKGILRWYDSLPPNPYLGVFFDRYREELLLTTKREGMLKDHRSPIDGAAKTGNESVQPPVSLSCSGSCSTSISIPPTEPNLQVVEEAPAVLVFPVTPEELFKLWEQERGEMLPCKALTDKRRAKSRARIAERNKDPAGLRQDFAAAIQKASTIRFFLGGGERGWKGHFDWFIENDTNYLKVLEGKYDGKRKSAAELKQQRIDDTYLEVDECLPASATSGTRPGDEQRADRALSAGIGGPE